MIDYIKTVFTKSKEIYIARNMKGIHYLLLIILLTLTLSFISVFEMLPAFNQLSNDYSEIKEFLPAFEVKDGQLTSEHESYVYQTDSIVFYFDPDDRMDTKIIDKNMRRQTAPVSIGLMDEELHFNILNRSQTFNYQQFNITANDLEAIILSIGAFSPGVIVLLLFVLYILNLFLYLGQLFSITLFANVISYLRRTHLRFIQNAKIALLASVIPFLTIYLFNAFQVYVPYQIELTIIASLLIFNISISEFKKRIGEHKDQ